MRCDRCKEMKVLTESGFCEEYRNAALMQKNGRVPSGDAMIRRLPGSFENGRRR